ncbi:hypothetical protein [Pseudoalteromonas piratica]|nr:hypothetical protein [Pseudoalteromonas piratica]
MFKLIVLSFLLVVSIFSTEAKGKCDISGIWNHSSKPAKLFVNLSKGEISVLSHDNNAKAIGLVVLKSIVLDSSSNSWDAKMYSAAEDSFVDVQIKSKSCNQLSVSFNNEEVLGLLR